MRNNGGDIADLARRVLAGKPLGRKDALLVAHARGDALEEVFLWSDRIRRKHFGNQVRFCSIVSGKLGGCGEDCAWCAQS